ncbi:hypothetical protein M5689_008671 [Euphorbia peplus]|nr:hypothetical protein M5689_008671 [Euphorbia peplus]
MSGGNCISLSSGDAGDACEILIMNIILRKTLLSNAGCFGLGSVVSPLNIRRTVGMRSNRASRSISDLPILQ